MPHLSEYLRMITGSDKEAHKIRRFLNGDREGWDHYPKEWDSPKVKKSKGTILNPYYKKKRKIKKKAKK